MKSLFKKDQGGKFFDVHAPNINALKRWLFFWREGGVVNLRQRKYRLLMAGGVFLIVILSFFGLRNILTRAEVANFNAATCLGTWQNPEKAQGEPENLTIKSSTLGEENSAVFSAIDNEIFCGQFIPDDFEARGEIKNVSLTLVWEVKGFDNADQGVEIIETETPEEPANNQPEEEIISEPFDPAQDKPEVTPAPEPNPENMEETSEPTTFKFLPIKFAFAETTSSELKNPSEPILTENSSPVEDPAVENPPAENSEEGQTVDEENQIEDTSPENTTGETETSSESQTFEPQTTEEFLETLEPLVIEPTEDFLKISYSLDGQDWLEIQTVGPNNWQNFTVSLPTTSWEDLKKIQVSIEGIPTSLETIPTVYLDGMFMEIQYEKTPMVQIFEPEIVQKPVQEVEFPMDLPYIVVPEGKGLIPVPTDKKNFSPNESPSFDLDLENLPTGNVGDGGTSGISPPNNYLGKIKKDINLGVGDNSSFAFLSLGGLNFVNLARAQSDDRTGVKVLSEVNPVIAQVVDAEGRPTAISPTILTVNNKVRVNVPEPKRSLRPGIYKLKVWVLRDNKVFFSETEFTWGVFAINFSKSIYKPGDIVNAGMAVLDEGGHTICDAQISLRVVWPSGVEKSFSTRDGSITYSDTCGPNNVTQEADYKTNFLVNATGTYKVFVTTRTANGLRDFEDKFEVQEEPMFDVLRAGPTRIYPPAEYHFSIKITPKEDFNGLVKEVVPVDFQVVANTQIDERISGEDKILIWSLNLRAGETREISYIFKAPNISPEFYKLGPLGFYQNSNDIRPIFSEIRSWQIAADAVVNTGSLLVYGDTTDANDPLNYRVLTSTSTWGSETNGVDGDNDIKHVVLKAAPTRNEYVAGYLMANGRLDFAKASDDMTWSYLFSATSSLTQVCDTAGGDCHQTFDLAYEQLSGEVLMTYGDPSNDGIIYYRTWDGNVTSSEGSFTFDSGSSVYTNWVRLVPRGYRLTDQRSDEMLLLIGNASGSNVFAAIWDGAQFGSTTTITLTGPTGAGSNGRRYDGAWETLSGNVVVVYATSTTVNGQAVFEYKSFIDGVWDADGTDIVDLQRAGGDGQAKWVQMDADPTSNRIAAGFSRTSGLTEMDGEGIWKADGATPGWTITSATSTLEGFVAFGRVQAAFERFGSGNTTSSALFTINTVSSTDFADYMTWISGTGFSATASIPSNWTNDGSYRKLIPSPNDDEMMWVGVDSDNDLRTQRWDGSTWQADPSAELNTNVGTNTDSDNTIENNAFDFAYKPYSPWSLNWQWYNGTSTADTPTDALAAENTSSSISSSSMKLRLRFNVAEQGGNSQTDARKKLQFTSSTTPNSSSTVWTDVDDVSGSEIWRYYDVDTGSAVGDDGGVVASTVLSSSTNAGWWTTDKDAAAGANMDHASTTVRELEFAIEGNNAPTSTSFYFRMYDVGQVSPVYRQQTSWPATPCAANSDCTYPSLVVEEAASAALTVSSVILNGATAITLTPNATTTITAVASTTGATPTSATGTIYRSSVTGGADCAASNLDCYQIESTSCVFVDTNETVQCSADIWYFADATDASSSYASDDWNAQITATDGVTPNTSSTTSGETGVVLNSLTSMTSQSSTIDYGSVAANADSGATNQEQPFKNSGNTSSGLTVYGSALVETLIGTNSIATGQQKYATSSFTYGTDDIALTETEVSVSNATTTVPTSTEAVLVSLFWGIAIPNGTATGTYLGTSTFGVNYGP